MEMIKTMCVTKKFSLTDENELINKNISKINQQELIKRLMKKEMRLTDKGYYRRLH